MPKVRISRCRSERRGSVKVLVLILMVPLFAFAALGVDVGWITMTRSQLQNAADASATAGASQLIDLYADYYQSGQSEKVELVAKGTETAQNWSVALAGQNSAGGISSLGLAQQDIEVGFLDKEGVFKKGVSEYPNTVKVRVRRDASSNSPLNLFFAPVLGRRNTSLNAYASATVYSGLIESFDPEGFCIELYEEYGDGYGCTLLPVALDVNVWRQFVDGERVANVGKGKDNNLSDSLKIYPSPQTAPGNVGLLCIGPPTNQGKRYSDWILNGPSPEDIEYLADNDCFPVNEESPKAWQASPGLRSSLAKDFEMIVGQPRLLPLFKPRSIKPYQGASGAGGNATYEIVGFAGVVLSSVEGRGGNLSICVKPAEVFDPTAIFDPESILPAGTEPEKRLKTFTYLKPRLTK